MTQMDIMENISLIASIVSIILGGFAIWLSITFYRLSNMNAKETREASNNIGLIVKGLEVSSDRLHDDTFSIVKDTVSDMRKHIMSENIPDGASNEIEQKANKKIANLKLEIKNEISDIFNKLGETNSKIQDIQTSIESIVNRAVSTSRNVEIETQDDYKLYDVKVYILRVLRRILDEKITIESLINFSVVGKWYSKSIIFEALNMLVSEKRITASGSIEKPDTIIQSDQK